MPPKGKLRFCESFLKFDGKKLISFDDRPYLPAIYAVNGRNLVLRCSRQTEKSTFLVNTILYEACTQPGIQILFVCPRREQAQVFSNMRLIPALEQSPLIRRTLLGCRKPRLPVMNMRFDNGSHLFVRAAYHSADPCRGISAQLLLVDEFQDAAEGDLPVLQETLSHAANPRTILTGTPKSVDNHLESVFRQSTANEWVIDCLTCQRPLILDERSIGPTSLACPLCGASVDPRGGHWVARNPDATWGQGFWIGHPMVPWLKYDGILERQQTYDIAKFKNEVLGLPTTAGDHVVTRAELEACCSPRSMARSWEDIPQHVAAPLIAGIDWGGGGTSRTVLVIGFMDTSFRFHVCRFERFSASEEPDKILRDVANRCRQFRVTAIGADGGGNGLSLNRLLLNRLNGFDGLYGIHYSVADHAPRRDGAIMKWTVNRSASLGVVFSRVKMLSIEFPRIEDCGSFLDEFACEVSEFDDKNRSVRYSHPESQQDDALHATNYALLVAIRYHHGTRQFSD